VRAYLLFVILFARFDSEGDSMSSGELWFVKLPNGDVHHVTLDQLDAAFQDGHINENTPVLADGATQWTTLGKAAGLEDEASPPAPVAAPSPTPAPVVRSVAPPMVQAAAPVSYAPQAAAASYAPRSAPVSYAPRSAPVSYAPVANSIRPVAMDLGPSPYLNDPFKKKSRKGWIVATMALASIGAGVGFAATNGKIAFGDSPLVAAAPPPAAVAPPPIDPIPAAKPPPPPAAPPPTPQAPLGGSLPATGSPLNPQFATVGKEPQADRTHQDTARHHSYAAQTSSKKSSVFSKGGSKFDPLNSDL
jgi:hypothetical protein